MKRLIYLGLITVVSCLSACSSYNYYTAAINKTNLSNYHTFAWMPPPGGSHTRQTSNLADAKIKDAVTAALVSKGLKLSQTRPDLVVSYSTQVGTGTKTYYYSSYYDGGFYPGWGLGFGYGWGWGYRPYYYAYGAPFAYYGGSYAERTHYKEGTIIIDLIDPRTRRIVWRGFGVGEVHKNPQKNIEDLPKVVNGVLAQLQLTPDRRS
ncbi:hypothetical protein BH09BAC6_BH09BAC6_09510 [soil metagenome]|jgi:hypothetical protein